MVGKSMSLPVSVINGRFKVLLRPNPAPGHCAVCGSVSKPVVDFDMTVDYYGAVLLCTDCVREAASILVTLHPELMAPTQVAPLFNGNLLDVGTVHEYLAASLDATNRLISILPDSDLLSEDGEGVSESIDDDAEGTSGSDEDSAQLNLFQGPDDVPSITGRRVRSIFDD